MRLILLIFNLIVILQSSKAKEIFRSTECSFPWQKVDDDICLFLTSLTKTWNHAKFLCNFYGGDLLYIQNKREQINIEKYLHKLIKYRFNKKPYIWLDATDKETEHEWKWSRNNQTIDYGNWIPEYHNKRKSDMLDCGCYNPSNGFWKDCDCSLSQHFTCRKPMYSMEPPAGNIAFNSKVIPSMSPFTNTFHEETIISNDFDEEFLDRREKIVYNEEEDDDIDINDSKENDENDDIEDNEDDENDDIEDNEDDENDDIKDNEDDENDDMNDNIQNEEDDINDDHQSEDLDETTTETTTQIPDNLLIDIVLSTPEELDKKMLVTRLKEIASSKVSLLAYRPKYIKKQNVKETIVFPSTVLMRKRLKKSDRNYDRFHCPQGLGYYLIENSGCTKYKHCEEWNKDYASLSLNKCRKGVFDFNKRACVPKTKNSCSKHSPKFAKEL